MAGIVVRYRSVSEGQGYGPAVVVVDEAGRFAVSLLSVI
jgi:cobalamin biosynthesis protein CbiG